MSIQTQTATSTSQTRRASAPVLAQSSTPPRREHRSRDFGIGYGSSSGYASNRRYADNWGNARFVCG